MSELEEIADIAIEELREFIDTEARLVQDEHDLLYKIRSLDTIIVHLNDIIPEERAELHDLNLGILEMVLEIKELIKSHHDLKIIKEDEKILQNLEKDVKHRDWRAVRKDIEAEKNIIKLEIQELKALHSKFKEFMNLIGDNNLISEKDHAKEKYEKLEEYYLLQIYKFAKAYEEIFGHLLEKDLRIKQPNAHSQFVRGNEANGRKKVTKVISAFPGIGKTYFYQNSQMTVLDSDSSKYSWIKEGVRNPDFPDNYIRHIKESIGYVDIILISSHITVREALVNEGIEFTLIFPERTLKDEYIERYRKRGSPDSFLDLLSKNWDTWISELEEQRGCTKLKLTKGQYLSDILQ